MNAEKTKRILKICVTAVLMCAIGYMIYILIDDSYGEKNITLKQSDNADIINSLFLQTNNITERN